MTASAWLAIGAAVAALAAPTLGAVATAVAALAVALAVAGTRGLAAGRTRVRRGAGIPIAIGALVVGLRVVVSLGTSPAGPAGEAAELPAGRGPWPGVVESRSANRAGEQPAIVRIRLDPGVASPRPASTERSIRVAATLPRYPAVEPGMTVLIDGTLEPPPEGAYGEYLRRTDVAATIRPRSLEVTGSADDPGTLLERLRRGSGDALAAAIPEPEAGLAAGIVVGLRDRVDRDLAADFTTVGASHVVAISGWNIAIVASTIASIAGRLARRRRAVLLVVAIVAYVLFAGASASVIRAAAMAGVVLLARETGRAGRAAAALGWAAALLLIAEPGLVTDAGFQLSTLATAGILAWADPLEGRLRRALGGRLPGWLAESLAVSLAAQAATLPVVLATFGRLSLIAPVTNLAVVPLVAPAMAAAVVALVGGAVVVLGGPLIVATLAGLPAWALLTAICTVVRVAADVPFASVALPAPWSTLAAIGVVAVPWLAWRARRALGGRGPTRAPRSGRSLARGPVGDLAAFAHPPDSRPLPGRIAILALAVAVGAVGLAAAHRPTGAARITVLDVGQGDSILVEGGAGGRMLVDGGPDPDRLIVELDRRLPPWDRRIDILVLTHPHEDHVAGLPILVERYRIGQILETGMRGPGPGYAAFARDLAAAGAPPIRTLATGATLRIDDIALHVLWPDPGRVPREPPDAGRGINDVSIVLLGEVAGRRFLLTGDVEDDVDPILARRGLPHVDILKVAHHGSGTASTPAFVDAVRPAVAVVSSGAGNPYGHPARSTIERLAASGARVLRTDTDGSVAITIDPDGAIAITTTGARPRALAPALPPIAAASRPATVPSVLSAPGRFACGIPSSG